MSVPNISMFRDTVQIETYSSISGFNAVTNFDAATTHRAQIIDKGGLLRTGGGDEVVFTKSALIHSPQKVITERDRITFPDGTQPAIVKVRAGRNVRGKVHVYTVMVGNSRRTG